MAAPASTDAALAWEGERRTRAAAAAAIAALGVFVGTVWRILTLQDTPRVGVLDSLDRLPAPGAIGGEQSLRLEAFRFYDDNAASLLAGSAMTAIGYLALGYALTYLAVATRARRPEMPRYVVLLPLIGGVIYAIATVLSELATGAAIDSILETPTVDEAIDIAGGGLAVFASLLGLPGALAVAFALVFVSLNAMRVGLLTRFMGILGMIAGTLVILQLTPVPVVLTFWLVMLAVLFAGRWPNGQPPAWRSGQAEPWPSSADARAQRQRAMAARRGEPVEPEPEPEPEAAAVAAPSPSASARKRKRKKR